MVKLDTFSVKNVTQWSLPLGSCLVALTMSLFFSRPIQNQETLLPAVELESLSGETVTLSSFEGKPLVINLWATWCGPCRRELPLFAEMARTQPSVTFLFVNQKESREGIEMFLQEENLKLDHVLLDNKGQLTQHFNVLGLPSTFFFDSQGNWVNTQVGEVSSVQLFNALTDVTRP